MYRCACVQHAGCIVKRVCDAWLYVSARFDVMIERPYDDDKEVRDIDSRLHALKNFLKTAKARTAQK